MKRIVILATCILTLVSSHAATFLVTSSADAGPGSLRQAILDANAPGLDVIQFQFAVYPVTIMPLSPLPDILDEVIIDATEPGCAASAKPRVQIDGLLAGGSFIHGLAVRTASPVTIKGLAIYRFSGAGILVEGNTGSKIQGNHLGTDASGTLFGVGNVTGIQLSQCTDVLVGGSQPCERNVISGNRGGGVDIFGGAHDRAVGNFIGTAASGTWALGNQYGVQVNPGGGANHQIGSTNPGEANVISGNAGDGVVITGPLGVPSNNFVEGNFIGTQLGGSISLPNGANGVYLLGGPTANFIQHNVIKFNTGDGVLVLEGTDNTIVQNSIADNGRLGIDLSPLFAVNPNDPQDSDEGPNRQQNYPLFSSLAPPKSGTNGTTFDIDLNSEPLTSFDLHFYWSPACDASGFGEGKHFFGHTNVTTDALGNTGPTVVSLPVSVPIGCVLTATATHPGGSTSEFSPCSPSVVAAAGNTVIHSGLPHQADGDGTLAPQADGTLQVMIPNGNGSDGVQVIVGGAEGWMASLGNQQLSAGGALKLLYLGHNGYMNAVQWSGETELRFLGPGRAELHARITPAQSFQLRVQLLSDDDQVLESVLMANGDTYPLSLCGSNDTLHVRSLGVLRMSNGAPAGYFQYDDDYCGTHPPIPHPPRWKTLRVFPESNRIGPAGEFVAADICDACPQCCFPYYVALDRIRIIPEPPPCLSCPEVMLLGPEILELFGNLHESIGSVALSPWLDFQGPQPVPWDSAFGPFPHPWTGGTLTVQSLSVGGDQGIDLIPSGSGEPLPPSDGGVDPHVASSPARYVSLDFNASGSPGAAVQWVRFMVEGPVPVGPGDPVEHVLHFQQSERGFAVSANFGAGIAGAPGAVVQYYLHGAPLGDPRPMDQLQVPSLPSRVAASTSVSPTGAPGFDSYWSDPGTTSPAGPQPSPWDEIKIMPMAANANVIPYITRYRVRYDGLEEFRISAEQALPARPGPLHIERLENSARAWYPTESGRPYRLEVTDSLTPPAWRTLEDFVGDGTVHQVTDSGSVTQKKFYRLLGF